MKVIGQNNSSKIIELDQDEFNDFISIINRGKLSYSNTIPQEEELLKEMKQNLNYTASLMFNLGHLQRDLQESLERLDKLLENADD